MATNHKPHPDPLLATEVDCFHCNRALVWEAITDRDGFEHGEWMAPGSQWVSSHSCEADIEHGRHVPDRRPFYVNVYAVQSLYGGPEEGGWYYDAGWPVASTPFLTRVEANAAMADARDRFPCTGARWRVHGGQDFTVCLQRDFAVAYPTEAPRYE